ncbi:MAG: hypothetical protein II609_05905, partial [Muribaculaceae bacterium]|nr:hypothetical protein [Muribaculaceae bacterium]
MKKYLLLLVAMVASLSAWAQNTVTTVTSSEQITKTSTVYVGEVVVDGQTAIKYLYSGDITIKDYVLVFLRDGLNGMADGDYAAMLNEHEFDYSIEPTQNGFALCNNSDLEASMDENWINAQYVGTLLYPDKTVKTVVNSNLYDLDEGFKAVLDAQEQDAIDNIDNPVAAEKRIMSHIDSHTTTNVYYTIEDGQVVRHVDDTVIFDCEATTVIYTKVELETAATTFAITVPESFEHGKVTCDKTEAAEGETVTLTVTPDSGYELENLIVTIVESEPSGAPMLRLHGGSIELTPGENGTYTFDMPAAPVTVNATFKETTVTGVTDINAAQPKTGARYNLMGQPVGKDYKGIVIEDG